MKKFFLFSLIALFVIGISSISFASVDSMYEAAIVNVNGEVKVDPNADGGWFTPWVGMKLKKGAVLKVGENSSAEIVFDVAGLNVLKIDANSQITIQKSMVDMPEGSVLANFANLKEGSSFVVKTPTAACSIRGSGMGVDHINNMTVATAYEDKVYVQGLDSRGNPVGKEVTIPEGWKTQVKAGKINPPAELTENERQIWNAWISVFAPTEGDLSDRLKDVKDRTSDSDSKDDTKDLDEVKEEASKEEGQPSVSP
ncbi:hypothetical protein ACFL5E_00040 [Candidatus Omnitrophota bacterium]